MNLRNTIWRHVLVIFLLFQGFTMPVAIAQYYDTGEDPGWITWRQLQSRHFNLIYPSSLDTMAQRYAWLFDAVADSVSAPLNTRLAKIPVVLHAYNVMSNGVVTWAPSRMELITTPPNDHYPQAWDKQLVLHETRHVAQMTKVGSHIVNALHWIIGDQAEGLTVGIFLPSWYLEGDATVSETALSSTGRGRSPKFLMPQKAYIMGNLHFKWDMLLNGSYRYLIPNSYELGYRLATYAHLKGGDTALGRSLDYTTKRLYDIPPFDQGLKKYAGMGEQQLETQSFAELQTKYAHEEAVRGADAPYQPLTLQVNDYEAYRYPVITHDHRIMALKNTLNRAAQLVEIDSAGHVRTRHIVGNINSNLHYNHGLIYWTEIIPHPRWPQQSYSVIKAYDTRTGRLHTLTHRTRFFSVSLNADGSMLTTIENTPEGRSRIVVIPVAQQGRRPCLQMKQAQYIAAPAHQTWMHTTWPTVAPGNQTQVTATLQTDNGIGLYEVDMNAATYTPLIPDNFYDIKRLTSYKNYTVFETGYDGVNNLYALQHGTNQLYKLTNARLGAFDPAFSPDSTAMAYANYHMYGYEIVKTSPDSLLWRADSFTQPYRYDWADSLSAHARFTIDTLRIPPALNYAHKPYHKATHLFRFHSWAPIYINPDGISQLTLDKFNQDIAPGVTLFSQNTLGTAITRLGYRYLNGAHSGHVEFTYKGWYPIVELNFDISNKKATQQDYRIYETNAPYVWAGDMKRKFGIATATSRIDPLINASARLYIPFNFSRNGWQRRFIPMVDGYFTNSAYVSNNTTPYFFRYLRGQLTWYSRMAMALRELYPRWGYMVNASYLNPLGAGVNLGDMASVQLTTYLPGLFTNHSVQLKAGYQWQNTEGKVYFLPLTLLNPPRGYAVASFEKNMVLSADYSFPLFYPDWNIAWVAFFKRFQMNLFADYATLAEARNNRRLFSAGFDLLADFHLFRFAFPITGGLRCAFPTTGPATTPTIELLFNVHFN